MNGACLDVVERDLSIIGAWFGSVLKWLERHWSFGMWFGYTSNWSVFEAWLCIVGAWFACRWSGSDSVVGAPFEF